MSVVLVVRSEEDLRLGMKWCLEFSENLDVPLLPVVVGQDRKVLLKHVESEVREIERHSATEIAEVLNVDSEVESVLELTRRVSCQVLVIPHSIDQVDWQQELFETAALRTVWLDPSGDPPADEAHLLGGFQQNSELTNRLADRLFGMKPSGWCVDESPPEDLDFDKRVSLIRERFDDQALHPESLILIGFESVDRKDASYGAALELLDHEFGTSVALIRPGASVVPGVIDRLRRWTDSITPPMDRAERMELQKNLESGSVPGFEFLGMISAASMLASFGLLQNSAAVIIGAMLIAPLMTPILGAGLALTLGNRPLFRTASLAVLLGVFAAFVSSALFGLLVSMFETPDLGPEAASEMWARCRPSPIDFCVGLVGGTAAAYARTRSYLSSALAGAAIAAALVPPISTAGLQVAFGVWAPTDAGTPVLGPMVVVAINILTITVASSLVLWFRGIRARTGKLRRQDRWAVRMSVLLVMLTLLILVALYGI
jgi:uncharacterized hydrophobic protein (TIGR00271 family)